MPPQPAMRGCRAATLRVRAGSEVARSRCICCAFTAGSAACQAWDKSDRLHRAQLDDADNPYNTYRHEGLPPGPICSPGEKSLRATVEPDGSGYFFFVAKSATDKHHRFARTIDEHKRNVERYVKSQ